MTVFLGSKRKDYSCHASLVEQRNSGLAPDEKRVCLPQADEQSHDSDSTESLDVCNCCNRDDGRCMCTALDIEFDSHDWCSYCYFTTTIISCSVCEEVYCECDHDSPQHVCHYMCERNFAYCHICSPRGIQCIGHSSDSMDYSDSDDTEPPEEEDVLPHAGVDPPAEESRLSDEHDQTLDLLKSIGKIDGLDTADEWISTLEGLVILMLQVVRARTPTDLCLALLAYIKSNTTRSLIGFILEKLPEVGEDVIEPHAWSASDCKQKWQMLRTNAIFPRVGYLISAALSLTVCKVNGVEWTMGGFEIFSLPAVDKQLSACSMMDAFVDVFEWCATTGYKIIEQKSLNPIFYSDNRMEEYNEQYLHATAHADSILNGNSGDVSEFEGKVDALIIATEHFRKLKANISLNLWLQERYSVLISLKERIISKQRNTAIRFRPMGIGLTGPSGVGKSTLAKIVMKVSLIAMGFDYDPNRIITKDMFDKYDSVMTSDVLGLFMDDVGNGKAQFVITSPTDVIIKFFNNMAATAVKAELSGKGVVFINFKVGVLTSNHKDYGVHLYTDIVEASLSRLIHTRVEVKKKYRKKNSVALDPSHPDLHEAKLTHDIWNLTIEQSELYPSSPVKNIHRFAPVYVKLNGKYIKCTNLDLKTYLRCIVILSRKHKAAQYDVIRRAKEFDEAPCCTRCSLVTELCDCPVIKDEPPELTDSDVEDDEIEPHSSELVNGIVTDIVTTATKTWFGNFFGPFATVKWWLGFRPVNKLTTNYLAGELSNAMTETTTPLFLALTPSCVYNSTPFKYVRYRWQKSAVLYNLRPWMKGVALFGVASCSISAYKDRKDWFALSLLSTKSMSLILYAQYWERCEAYKREYMERTDAVASAVKSIEGSAVRKGAAVLATFIISLRAAKMWIDSNVEPNGLVTDQSPGWFGFINKMAVTVGSQDTVKHASTSQVITKITKNIVIVDFTRPDGTTTRCNGFFPQKGVMWIPKHVFYTDCDMTKEPHKHLKAKIVRGKGPGSQFEQTIAASMCVFTDIDLVVVNVSKCPDLGTTTGFLPTTRPEGSCMAKLVLRNTDYDVVDDSISVKFGQMSHRYASFYGGSYDSSLAKVGACMGPIVQDGTKPVVLGFHIGGTNNTYGVMETVLLSDHERWLKQLKDISGVFVGAEPSPMPEEIMGRQVIKGPVHPHAAASRLPDEAAVVVLGSTALRTKQKTCVVKSILADHMADVFKFESKWGPPELEPNWKCYNATLEHLANPGDTFKPDELERARQDWLEPLFEKVGEVPDIRPLTLQEAVMGIDGERFIDPIDMSTSMCHPVFGKKRPHFEDTWHNGKLISRTPSEEIMFEIERVENCWKHGKRANVVWSSNLKDEPTPFTKKSVRVFQGSPVVLTILMRKYFLKIVRFLGLHSIEAECAVGVNAFGKEWEILMAHSEKYSENTDLGWDYSKYDVRMNSQLTIAAYMSLIDLAVAHGYDDDDIYMMHMMLYDIVHPFLDYNGTLLQVFNMNTSGNSLTVIINSIVGSLLVRMGFFHVYPEKVRFRDYVAALTYGDDFKGSVKPECADFHFVSYHDFLALFGMKITHPNKTSEAGPFLSKGDLDFLKRMSNYIPEIARFIGMLNEESILKPLYVHLKSTKATMREVACDAVENALHEWFAHGRDVYEDRRSKLQEVCKRASLPVMALETDFDARVLYWKEKYD